MNRLSSTITTTTTSYNRSMTLVVASFLFHFLVLTSQSQSQATATTSIKIVPNKKKYKFNEKIKVSYTNPNVKRTNYIAIYKKNTKSIKWGKESFWSSLCNDGNQNSWPCLPDSDSTEVEFSVLDPSYKGGDGTNWPPPSGNYQACLLNRNVNTNKVTVLKCKGFKINGYSSKILKRTSVGAKKTKYEEGESILIDFTFNKKKDFVRNSFVALYKGGKKPKVPIDDDPTSWVYTACNGQEGNQEQSNYCSNTKQKGTVTIQDLSLKKGKYFACLILDNNKPYKYVQCGRKITIEEVEETTFPTSAPSTTFPTSAPSTTFPTSTPSTSSPTPSSFPKTFSIDWQITNYDDMTAKVGDVVEFNFQFGHNVYIYPKASLNNDCDSTDKIEVGLSSGASYEFTESDASTDVVFACGIGQHCVWGMRIKFSVSKQLEEPTATPTTSSPTSPPPIYELIGEDVKCPLNESRLFKREEYSFEECYEECYNRPGCVYFTHSVDSKLCMGCDVNSLPLDESDGNGYVSYEIKTFQNFPYTLNDRDTKCLPENRLDKTNKAERDDCYDYCAATLGCVSFTYYEGDNLSASHKDICMLCDSVDALTTDHGFNSYEMELPMFPTSTPSTYSPSKSPSPTPDDIDKKSLVPTLTAPPSISYSPSKEHNNDKGGLAYSTLQCNIDASKDIESDMCLSDAIDFSTLATLTDDDEPLSIPCGVCVTMDYTDGSVVSIPGGLHVLGRLHFPSSANVVLRTTAVFVQGLWSMKIPDQGNKVRISLFGYDEQTLYPHDKCCTGNVFNLDDACLVDCEDKMSIGKKPFVVAGGKLDIRAVDENCKSWTKLKHMDTTNMNTITVDPNFVSCLSPGDPLLFTSDRRDIEYETQHIVASVDKDSGEVVLQESLPRIFPAEDGPGESFMAIEVAKLSRDVIFEAENEPEDEMIGGHSIIFFTPEAQTIQGVQFENFGQAGVLGRYPIHFHICGESHDSLVSKNVIINSNQRCVFIHSTDYVTIDDNVAYNTPGHCYSTETGSERFNIFSNNLGAGTKRLTRSNGQSDSAEGFHLHQAATFWFRNMENTFVGNIAAGSKSVGFWIEHPDKYMNQGTGIFEHNVAHTCEDQGLITYKPGWKPVEKGFINHFTAYNNGDAVKFHITGNIEMHNILLADNLVGIRYAAWNYGVLLQDSTIIAMTQDRKLRLKKNCPAAREGINASFNRRPETMGQIVLKNVTFIDFICTSDMIQYRYHNLMQDDMGDPIESYDLKIGDNVEESKPTFDCDTKYWEMAFLEDYEGTLAPKDRTGPGFFITNSDRMKALLDDSSCEVVPYDVEDQCTAYCESICIRLVHLTPTGRSSKIGYASLKLTDIDTGISHTFSIKEDGKAILVLPVLGQYIGDFIDMNGDSMVMDTVSVETFRSPRCAGEEEDPVPHFTFLTNPPTIAPTVAPTVTPKPTYGTFYELVGIDLKCTWDKWDKKTRLFTEEQDTPFSIDECHKLCFDEPGCEYFSLGDDGDSNYLCMGCTPNAEYSLSSASGFTAYQLIVFQWFWPAGVDLKCPLDDRRLFKRTDKSFVECYEECFDRPGCVYFSHSTDTKLCMGCDSNSPPLDDTEADGFMSYKMETFQMFPYKLNERDTKCLSENRLDKTETSERVDCYNLCADRFGCVSFTFGEGDNLSSSKGTCMLCDSADAVESHTGFNTYQLK